MTLYLVTTERVTVEQSVINTTDAKQAEIIATNATDHAARISTTHHAPKSTVVELRPVEDRP